MGLVDDLIRVLSSDECNLESALAKAQILAHRLNAVEMTVWVLSELRGYSSDDVPEYRQIACTVVGNVSNGFYQASRATLPISHLDARVKDSLTIKKVRQSVSTIQGWAKSEDALSSRVSPELYGRLSEALGNDYQVESAWCEVSAGAFVQIISQVRSRLLDFVLQLASEIPQLGSSDNPTEAQKTEATNLFKNAVFGSHATIIIGNGNTQNVTSSIRKNDFESLAAYLESLGLRYAEINDLRTSIEADRLTNDPATLGTMVREWIGRMAQKAEEAAWNVSSETAVTVLTTALLAYLGMAA